MGVDSGALIKTLNPTCLDALDGGCGALLSRTNPSVEIEHWLTKLVEAPNTDLTRIFTHFEVDPARVLRDLTKVMDQFRTGNQRTPTLSLKIDELIRAAWVLASVQYGLPKVRSGVLLLALLDDAGAGPARARRLARAGQDQGRGAPGQPDQAGGRLGRGPRAVGREPPRPAIRLVRRRPPTGRP